MMILRRSQKFFNQQNETKHGFVDWNGTGREEPKRKAAGEGRANQRQVGKEDTCEVMDQIMPGAGIRKIGPSPVVRVHPDGNRTAVGSTPGDLTEQHAKWSYQSHQSKPEPPILPQSCLPPDD